MKNIDGLKLKEMSRQKRNMKVAQSKELLSVEESQRIQFGEFTNAWDDYMREYEETALKSLEELKEKHLKELKDQREHLRKKFLIGNRPVNKDILEMKAKERAYLKTKQYKKAERMQKRWMREEEKDLQVFMENDFKSILKKEDH